MSSKWSKLHSSMQRTFAKGGGSHETVRASRSFVRSFVAVMKARNLQIEEAEQIKGKHIKAFVEARKAAGISLRAIQNNLTHLRNILDILEKKELLRDPALSNGGLGIGGASRKGTNTACSEEKMARIQSDALARGLKGCVAIIGLQRYLGLREKEGVRTDLETLHRWASKIAAGERIRVENGTKGGRPRDTLVAEPALALEAIRFAIKVAAGNGGYLIRTRGKLKTAYNRYKKFANSVGLKTHSLRYAFAQARFKAYRQESYSVRAACTATGIDLGHGDGRGRYIKMVYALGQVEKELPKEQEERLLFAA